jgi:hypothetical protein
MASSKNPTKDPNISEAPAADLESEHTNQDSEGWKYKSDRAELTELTPVEAFKWSVEGDQSPCMLTRISQQPMLILLSPGGCGLCVQQR